MNMYSIGLFFDISKAFNTVNHNILLKKLNSYGIHEKCLDWIENYLQNRKQLVIFNGISSSLQNISCGVPQGSILGPLLFLIYINDIAKTSRHFNFTLFADDTTAIASDPSLTNLIKMVNHELTNISHWFTMNKLSLNVDKTNYIIFHDPHRKIKFNNISIHINNTEIKNVSSTKFLGVIVDQSLTWKEHIKHIGKKISKNIGILYKMSRIVPINVLFLLYFSLIYPYLFYCNSIWCTNYRSRINTLESLHNRAIRMLSRQRISSLGYDNYENCILSIDQICIYQTLLFMFKYHHNLLPRTFLNFFPIAPNIQYSLRSRGHYRNARIHTTRGMFSIKYFGPRIWNSVLVDYEEQDFQLFKKSAKSLALHMHLQNFLPCINTFKC